MEADKMIVVACEEAGCPALFTTISGFLECQASLASRAESAPALNSVSLRKVKLVAEAAVCVLEPSDTPVS